MTDCICESCVHFHVGWDMHSECSKGVVGTDEYRSCKEGCEKYKCVAKGDDRQ